MISITAARIQSWIFLACLADTCADITCGNDLSSQLSKTVFGPVIFKRRILFVSNSKYSSPEFSSLQVMISEDTVIIDFLSSNFALNGIDEDDVDGDSMKNKIDLNKRGNATFFVLENQNKRLSILRLELLVK